MIAYSLSIRHCFLREVLLMTRQLRFVVNASLFFFMILVFFPLTLPSETQLLRICAPGLVWIAFLLATILSTERIFLQDYEDGVIEQWLVSAHPLSVMVFIKVFVHWLFSSIPIVLVFPMLALLFNLTLYEVFILMLSLLFGSPALFFLCVLASVSSSGIKQKGLFMALIVLPLTIPIMIFGSGVVNLVGLGLQVQAHLLLLLAMSLLCAGLLPFAIASMIRMNMVE